MDTNFTRQPMQQPSVDDMEAKIAHHAPAGWEERFNTHGRLADAILEDREFMLLVVVADVRNSTLLQKEAVSFRTHAAILTRFVESAADTIRVIGGGWFDRFTGDGFLAYWILRVLGEGDEPAPFSIASQAEPDFGWADIKAALTSSLILHWSFAENVMRDFRSNSQNVPSGAGLAIGVDVGPAHFATVAGDLTILGQTVVGAVRMVSTAKAGEIVANVQLGQLLEQRHEEKAIFGLNAVRREVRATKEFPAGQEVYVLVPSDDQIAELAEPPGRARPGR